VFAVNTLLSRCGIAALLIVPAGCAKRQASGPSGDSASVRLVADAERSRHFDAVSSHLELGGVLYGYADIDGDALALASSAQVLVHQLAVSQPQLAALDRQDLKGLFSQLGLSDIKAVGFSSVRDADGIYRNRTFLFTPGGRHGLLAAFGGQPGRFIGSRMAPPDCDFYSETEFDVNALYDTVRSVVSKVGGREAADALAKKLKNAGADSGFSVLDVIQGMSGRMTIILRMDPGSTYQIRGPNGAVIPAFSAIVRVEGVGGAVSGALSRNGALVESKQGSLTLFTPRSAPPLSGLKPVLAVQGKAFFAATSPEFLQECLHRTEGIETNPEFATGLAALGPEGNGLTWVSQRFFGRLREIGSLNPSATAEQKRVFDVFTLNLPIVTRPLLSIRINLSDGILVRSNWNKSLKSDIAMFTIYNPVTIGLMASMAIPAFQKVRQASQEKAILNNLHTLYDAGEQYYLINRASSATYDELVGPGKFVAEVQPVAGEDYRSLTFKKGLPLMVRLPDGRAIAYPAGAVAPSAVSLGDQPKSAADIGRQKVYDQIGVVNNLYTLDEAAKKYCIEHNVDTVAYADLVGPGKLLPEVKPVAGEDYTSLVFKRGQRVEVRLSDGRIVRYPLGAPENSPRPEHTSEQAPAPDDPQAQAMIQNLQILNDAANKYYADHDSTTATFEMLVGPGKYLPSITPVAGEDYRSLLFKKDHPLRLYLKDGRVITFPPQRQQQ
jgi:type IV pilus assembly protein PilA